jgi:hypothetical protein
MGVIMKYRVAGLVFTALSLLLVTVAPASAISVSPSVSTSGVSPAEDPPKGCVGQRYGTLFGEGVAVNCAASGEGKGYQVVAHCSTGSTFWYALGTYVPYGFGPSVSECEGDLLTPAFVGGYHVTFG